MDDQHEKTYTLEEAIESFNRVATPYIGVEENFDIDRESIPAAQAEMKLVERCVIYENLFSENEDFEEIAEEYIK